VLCQWCKISYIYESFVTVFAVHFVSYLRHHIVSYLLLYLPCHSVPQYLSDFCTPVANVAARSQLRSTIRHLVVIPRYNRSTYGRRAFSVAGPMTWNSLTDSLRDLSLSIDSFRRQLKTFLFDN